MIFDIKKNFNLRSIVNNQSPAKSRLITLLLLLLLVVFLHSLAMLYLEKMPLRDALWLSLTSVTTVGYGDYSAQTNLGRIATVILLYVIGIAILAQSASTYFEYRFESRYNILKGKCKWKMKNHIVFVNCPKETAEEFFYNAIHGLRESSVEMSKLPVAIISDSFKDGIPAALQKLDVAYINQGYLSKEAIEASSLLDAKIVIVLSRNRFDPNSDSINFEITDRLRAFGFKERIIVEVTKDENRQRIIKAGANSVVRPIRTYPEMLTRSILAPGSEKVIETIFNSKGEECIRYDVKVSMKWIDVIINLAKEDIGLPVAYEDLEGNIINNPSSKEVINSKAIFVLVTSGKIKKASEIANILSS